MIDKFNKFWKNWGQLIGFVGIIVYLNAYFLILSAEMQTNKALAAGWLVSFFVCCGWYAWQMRVHGWRLPEDIKNTH